MSVALCGFASSLLAQSPPAQTAQGSPLLPTNPSSAGPSDVAGLQTTPQQPGAGSPGTGSSYFNTRTERGVAGSGLPREKITEVDAKKLRSNKTDSKFSKSLLDSDLKTVSAVKAQPKTNDTAGKQESKQQKLTQSADKSSSESSKPVSANKTDGNH